MLPMNTDLLDTLVFERQEEIQRRMHRLSIGQAEPHPVLDRLRAAVGRWFGSGAAAASARPETATAGSTTTAAALPVTLIVMRAPAPIEEEALDRAA